MAVTYSNVAFVAAELSAKNQVPTIDKVRELLGTGSKTTISKYLQQWKAKQDTIDLYSSENVALPSDLVAHVKGLWDHILCQAKSQIDTIKQEFVQNTSQLEKKISEQQELICTYEKNEKQLKKFIEDKNNLIETNQAEIQELQETIIRTDEQLINTKQQLNTQTENYNQLHKHLEALNMNLTHYQNAIQEQRTQQALELENICNRYEQMLMIEREDKKKMQQLIDSYKQQVIDEKIIYTQNIHSIEILEEKISHLEQLYKEKLLALDSSNKVIQSKDDQINNKKAEVKQLNKNIVSLHLENKEMTLRINTLEQINIACEKRLDEIKMHNELLRTTLQQKTMNKNEKPA